MNRIQRVRRFRLATLVMTLGAVLAVSIPAAAPALAAANDTIRISPASSAAGGNGSSFTVKVITNTGTNAASGVQASITFDQTALQITAVARSAAPSGWATAPVFQPSNIPAAITAANGSGKLATVAASFIGSTVPNGADNAFIDVTFQVTNCPASGSLSLGLPIGPADAVLLDVNGATISPITATGATVTCTPPQANDFSIAANPATLSIPQGGTQFSTISTTLTSGNAQAAALSFSGLPANVTASFGAASLTGNASANLTFTVAAVAAVGGPTTVTVTGTGPDATHTTTVALTIVPPPAGPPPATGTTTVSGTVDAGFLGVSVQGNTALRLRRNAPNETSVPVLIFANTQWTLKIEDSMIAPKAAADRGHMLDTGASPIKRLSDPMQAYVPVVLPAVPLVRTLDIVGPQSLASGTNGATVPVTLSQLTHLADPPGNYAIDITFSAISGF